MAAALATAASSTSSRGLGRPVSLRLSSAASGLARRPPSRGEPGTLAAVATPPLVAAVAAAVAMAVPSASPSKNSSVPDSTSERAGEKGMGAEDILLPNCSDPPAPRLPCMEPEGERREPEPAERVDRLDSMGPGPATDTSAIRSRNTPDGDVTLDRAWFTAVGDTDRPPGDFTWAAPQNTPLRAIWPELSSESANWTLTAGAPLIRAGWAGVWGGDASGGSTAPVDPRPRRVDPALDWPDRGARENPDGEAPSA